MFRIDVIRLILFFFDRKVSADLVVSLLSLAILHFFLLCFLNAKDLSLFILDLLLFLQLLQVGLEFLVACLPQLLLIIFSFLVSYCLCFSSLFILYGV